MEVLNDDTQIRLSNGVDVDVYLPLFFFINFILASFLRMMKNMVESSFPFPPLTSSWLFMVETFRQAVWGGIDGTVVYDDGNFYFGITQSAWVCDVQMRRK